jgi:hypothetical protein
LSTKSTERGEILSNLSKFTDFALCIKTELLKKGRNQKWLEQEITEKTGLYIDSGYMYKIMTGQRNAPKIIKAICEILGIENPEN